MQRNTNNKLRQKQRKVKQNIIKQPKTRMFKMSNMEIMQKISSILQNRAIRKLIRIGNTDKDKRSSWLVEHLRFKAELKRERILQRNLNVEVFKSRNYNGV